MNTGEKIQLSIAVLAWVAIAIGLIFSLSNQNFNENLVTHIKILYFISFVLFTFIGIVYLKIFFGDKK